MFVVLSRCALGASPTYRRIDHPPLTTHTAAPLHFFELYLFLSSIELVCRVASSTPPPAYVFWFKQDKMVNYDHSER